MRTLTVLALVCMASRAFGSVAGPNSPSTCANSPFEDGAPWNTASNATTSNDTRTFAITGNSPSHESDYLSCTSFGFSIPAGATIDGIVVENEISSNDGAASDYAQRIIKGGSIGATDNADTGNAYPTGTTNEEYRSHGSSSNLWGETWAVADINASNFGTALRVTNGADSSTTTSVDHVRISVYYTEATPTATPTPSAESIDVIVANTATPTATVTPTTTRTQAVIADPRINTLGHQQKCSAVSLTASATQEVCVVWDQPFSQCDFDGDHPQAPCQQPQDCGTSQPCTFLNYAIDTDVADASTDTRGIMVHHVTYINGTRACVLAWNQDPTATRDATICIDGYTGGLN